MINSKVILRCRDASGRWPAGGGNKYPDGSRKPKGGDVAL